MRSETSRSSPATQKPLAAGRLLILSPFPPDLKRGTTAAGIFRNRFVAALADEILIAHATPGGKIERLAREVAAWGKSVQAVSGDTLNVVDAGGLEPPTR